jgi:hypothetical protein
VGRERATPSEVALPIFLSFPKPFTSNQDAIIQGIRDQLIERGLEPRTLGINEYDNEVPLRAVRRILLESNGVLTIGLRRYWVNAGAIKPGVHEVPLQNQWFTSPWPHIETAMGYQLGLPILALREQGVHTDGVLERGTVDIFVPEVDTSATSEFLVSQQWRQMLASWERDVRMVAKNRGTPPKLY